MNLLFFTLYSVDLSIESAHFRAHFALKLAHLLFRILLLSKDSHHYTTKEQTFDTTIKLMQERYALIAKKQNWRFDNQDIATTTMNLTEHRNS